MTVNVDYAAAAEKKPSFDYRGTAAKVVETAVDYAACPYEAEVNVLLADDDEIRKMNKEFRGIDRPTDVLSFPMVSFAVPADFSGLKKAAPGYFDPDSGELLLGDIVISVDKVRSQAESYGHSPLREYAFLIAHSILHLFGYDHENEEDAQVMEEKQEAILTELGITR